MKVPYTGNTKILYKLLQSKSLEIWRWRGATSFLHLYSYLKLCSLSAGGVPVNVMEIVRFPLEGTPENHKAIEVSFVESNLNF